ncbi:MAG: ParB/Srx family N-terminal domain-containing protein [Sporolactobacillus sp.]
MKRFLAALMALALIACSAAEPAQAASYQAPVQVPINQLIPTQAALGKLQIAAKVSGYYTGNTPSSGYYNDFNDDNGYVKGAYLDQSGNTLTGLKKTIYNSGSVYDYVLQNNGFAPGVTGTPSADVVIGPGHKYYLVDGHHGVSEYLFVNQQTGRGDTSVNVNVEHDWSSDSAAQFAADMNTNHYYFDKAYNAATRTYETVDLSTLPAQMGLANFINDPFRSLNYFWRNSAINKDSVTALYAEFYWGEFMVATGQFKDLSFTSDADYITAFNRGNTIYQQLIGGDAGLTALFQQVVTAPTGYTASQLGLQSTFNSSAVAAQLTKLQNALAYADATPSVLNSSNSGNIKFVTDEQSAPPAPQPAPVASSPGQASVVVATSPSASAVKVSSALPATGDTIDVPIMLAGAFILAGGVWLLSRRRLIRR